MKPRTLTVASVFPSGDVSLAGQTLQMWMDAVTEATDGAITFDVHWGGALGAPPEHLDLVRSGTVDLAFSSATYTPSRTPLDNIEYVFPFGPRDAEIVVRTKQRLRDEFPQIHEDYAAENVVQVLNTATTEYHLMSREPIATLEDLRGKKVSLIGQYFGQWVDAIGSSSVTAPAAERYTMLQTGVVDVDALAIDLSYTYRIHEVAPHFLEVGLLIGVPYHLWINRDVFHQLPPETQDLLLELGREVELRAATELIESWTERIYREWQEAGVTFRRLSDAEREEWARLAPDTAAQWAQDVSQHGDPGWEMVQRYQEISSELGYKWPRRWGVRD